MNYINIAQESDPFGEALSDLGRTLRDFAPLATPLGTLETMLSDIDGMLKTVRDLIAGFEDADRLIGSIAGAMDFLTPVPIVGEIADAMAGLIESGAEVLDDVLSLARSISDDVIKPLMKVLEEIVQGLDKARMVVVDIGQKVPGYINTVEILHYLSEIAAPIAKVLRGTKPADDLQAVLDTFNTVQDDVGKALGELDPALRAVDAGAKDLTGVLNGILGAMGAAGKDALGAVESATDALHPILDGFNRMVEAVKPLKWALDAISCVFDTILKPAIDMILRATGLESLVQTAEEAVFGKLGIAPVLELSRNKLGDGSIKTAGDTLGPDEGAGTPALWEAMEAALGRYRSGDSSATKTAILTVIEAIARTPIDPGKPSQTPPFPPNLPDLTKAPEDVSRLAADCHYIPRPVRRMDMGALIRLVTARPRPSSRAMLVAFPELRDDLPKVDPRDWPSTAVLIGDIDTLCARLDALAPEALALQASLSKMDEALRLPETFQHQVADLQALLADAVHILNVLQSFDVDFVDALVRPFAEVAEDQNARMAAVADALPHLTDAVGALDEATQTVMAAFPDAGLVEDTLRRVEGWRLCLGQSVALVRAARIKDTARGDANKEEIEALAGQIEASAAELHARLNAITGHCREIGSAVTALQGAIGTYAEILQGVSRHSTLISDKALPVADQAVHVLGIVNSIIDPLAGVIGLLEQPDARTGGGCVDGSSAFKTFGATAAAAMRGLAISDTDAPKCFAAFAEGLSEEALPLTDMAEFVSRAGSTLSAETVRTFEANAVRLAGSLKGLTSELKETRRYAATITTRQGDRKEISVANDIFDGAMVARAQALLNSLGLSAGGQRRLPPSISSPSERRSRSMDTHVCMPPAIVPDFTDHFKAEAHRSHFRPAEPPPEACSPKLGGRAAADCASFTIWTQYTAAFAGCLGTAANLAYESMEDRKAAMEIVTGLHAIYAAVQGVNLQFLQAIHDINENEAYHPIPKPDTIPDFPTPTKGHEIGKIVESAWALVRLMLETALRKLPPGSLWVEVLNGLIASSDNVIAQIKNLFGSKAD